MLHVSSSLSPAKTIGVSDELAQSSALNLQESERDGVYLETRALRHRETMELENIEQIGNVPLKQIIVDRTSSPVHAAGAAERRLYMKFKLDPNYGADGEEMRYTSWAEEYHLSPLRHNLLKWFPFVPGSTILEVGAGCGALTGLLCRKSRRVVALEYSKQRALITAVRHSQNSNLEVVVGGLQDFVSDEKFDYVTVIGVLEYAGKFYGGERPHRWFLAKLRDMLNRDGKLILAIENKIGLKYVCGAREDHTGRVFDSIYDYPHGHEVHTFSKKELSDLLYAAGFDALEWYYPLPDYKLPQAVISDKITVKQLDPIWRSFPAATGRRHRKEILSEKRFGRTLAQAGLFGEFANSFLVVAGRADARVHHDSGCLRFFGADMGRKRKFRTNKLICRNDRKTLFVLSPDNDDAADFVHQIAAKEALAKTYFCDRARVATGELSDNALVYAYLPFPSLAELIGTAIIDGDVGFGRSWIDDYLGFLRGLPAERCVPHVFLSEMGMPQSEISEPLPCFCCGIIDCVPHNILFDQQNEEYHVIDNEFTYDFHVPIDFVIWRAVHTLVVDLQNQIQSCVSEERPVVLYSGHGANREYIPLSWLDVITSLEIPVKQQMRWASAFQNTIVCRRSNLSTRLKTKPRVLKHVAIAEIDVSNGTAERIYEVLRKAKRLF